VISAVADYLLNGANWSLALRDYRQDPNGDTEITSTSKGANHFVGGLQVMQQIRQRMK
jgi:hypothetical protein